MPWTVNDVDRFKKGLSPAGKKKWVAIANAALFACEKKGGKGCDGRAVRIANGSVNEADMIGVGKSNNLDICESSSSTIQDYSLAEILMEQSDPANPQSDKREMVVTLLKEGPGNKAQNNYYLRSALESTQALLTQRPKQYFNHAANVDDPNRDVRDWASSVLESWIDTSAPKAKLKARVKVFDNWLWERAKMAPDQLAVSIEGKGAGKPEAIDGKLYNVINAIKQLNGVNWVDYPGNADMGVKLIESEKNKTKQEGVMELKDLLEGIRGLSAEQLKEVAESRPELKEFFLFPPEQDEKTKKDLSALTETVNGLKKEYEGQIKGLSEKLAGLEKENTKLSNIVESHEIKEKSMEKEKLVAQLLAASKLQEAHKTETFRRQLLSVKEYKEGDKTITETDQMKQLIEDREKICIAEVAKPDASGASTGTEISETEKHRKFTMNVFGIDPKAMQKEPDEEPGKKAATK